MGFPKGKVKPTRTEIEQRVLEVYTLLIRGYTRTEIMNYCTTKFSVKEEAVSKYIGKATKKTLEDTNIAINVERAESTLRYKSLFKKLYESSNFVGAIKAQERVDKILGLESPVLSTVNVNITNDKVEKLKTIFEEV